MVLFCLDANADCGHHTRMPSLDDIPTLPPANLSGDDMIAVIDGSDRRSPRRATLSQLGASIVPTAIAADPESAWESLAPGADVQGTLDAINSQPVVSRRMANWTAGGGGSAPPIRIMTLGDSLCNFNLGPKMGPAGTIGLQVAVTSGTITSHAAPSTSNFDYWISGKATTFAIGASAHLTFGGQAGGDIRGDRACIGVIKGPGRGSFVLQYASNGTGSTDPANDTGWTTLATINTAAASLSSEWLEYALPTSNAPFYRLRIKTVTTGEVTVVAPGIFNTNGGGVIWIGGPSTDGGLEVPYLLLTPDDVFYPIWRGLRPDLVLSCWADTYLEWEPGGAFRTFYDKVRVDSTGIALTGVSTTFNSNAITFNANTRVVPGMMIVGPNIPAGTTIATVASSTSASLGRAATGTASGQSMVLSNPPDWVIVSANPGAACDPLQRESQRKWALEFHQTYINGAEMIGGTFEVANEHGFMADVVHLGPSGVAARNNMLWSVLPIGDFDLGAFGGYNGGFTANQSSNMDNVPIEFGRSISTGGALAGFFMRDRNAPMNNANTIGFTNAGGEAFLGDKAVLGRSTYTGVHAPFNGSPLGGRGSFWWNLGGAGLRLEYSEVSANYPIVASDYTIDVTANSPTVTLPLAQALNASTGNFTNTTAGAEGKIYVIKNSGAGTVTLATTSSQTINGSPPGTLAAGASIKVQSTGAGWITIP